MKTVIIGSGNVAFHLSKAFYNAGINIIQIAARNQEEGIQLAKKINSEYVSLENIDTNADLYLLAIKDDAIQSVAKMLYGKIKEDAIIVHTSGSTSIAILEKYFENVGCLYPLQTFSKQKNIELSAVPFFITANLISVEKQLVDFLSVISKNVSIINDNQRLSIHIAAVFVCNFTNHMLSIGSEILHHHLLNFEIMKPLINETIEKALQFDPVEMQTGPAVREDKLVMEKHIDFLKMNPNYQKIYQVVSESIIEMKSIS